MNKNLKMFCITIKNEHLNLIQDIGYYPVGLGEKILSKDFVRDNTKINITKKNQNYGEYTFHYWLWKNNFDAEDKWIGFCQYRKFWANENFDSKTTNFKQFKNMLLQRIPKQYESYEAILGTPQYVNQFRLSKFIKHNLKPMIKNPILFIDKSKRSLKFHFDMMHGHGNLKKAINLLDDNNKIDFDNFMNKSVSFSPHNMFICKSKKILMLYYDSLFPWLERCEKIFGFDLEGYGLKRIYGFLAERYLSYWFQKYTKCKILPIIFKDISDYQ